jgi:hypothetical protein
VDPLYTTFLLKRLFYFSDEKVSISVDHDTLHYIFCQCLDAVVAMTHPCSTADEAVLFAALQCQICFGDFQVSILPILYLPSPFLFSFFFLLFSISLANYDTLPRALAPN